MLSLTFLDSATNNPKGWNWFNGFGNHEHVFRGGNLCCNNPNLLTVYGRRLGSFPVTLCFINDKEYDANYHFDPFRDSWTKAFGEPESEVLLCIGFRCIQDVPK